MVHERNFSKTFDLVDESSTILYGQALAQRCQRLKLLEPGLVIYLEGDLGMGKTCFSRAFIQHFLPGQRVKSPTYTLIESYTTNEWCIHHFDLYRLCQPEELEYLGVRDLLTHDYIALIEWPNKAKGFLPPADISIEIYQAEEGRKLKLQGCSALVRQQWSDFVSMF
ncbi:tRNA (adenosine(37)-N6)-threonylcarbamoyltransferase complex ATPase subunit type 1 TsaE [Thiomicrospira sp. R3]|uniref:tRNA (adenosine(37)-N6)-threonylcarbamoyltransferase complex ATPase subunit type 1 TsaE n=1 Tax=Thiomicrospira sp. R3 TaxID=3035472 RepID=UPI00259BC017|nr:tRNA (adenosine(37)-N6)-threonylcarbamoyltransferase complex ATPase subunit type 1 TsaE [Thiomicrospira sp. R3]WFE68980.1 tRNA (adenosine(37)-N6)-threonylcarbamoyltransferase complex ATPase subunit type 1 TsaE [Thiomicrospira sp. R3]